MQAALRAWRAEHASAGTGLDAFGALGTTPAIGTSHVHADPPARDAGTHNRMPEAFRALMRSATREVLISNAYIIPDEIFVRDLRELAARGVRMRILTNSLASHDVPAVNAHYERWRGAILDAGAALHELRADPAIQRELVDTPPIASGFVGLHVKAMVVDRESSFVGSMNLDPRSDATSDGTNGAALSLASAALAASWTRPRCSHSRRAQASRRSPARRILEWALQSHPRRAFPEPG